jgi:hypothetical protein
LPIGLSNNKCQLEVLTSWLSVICSGLRTTFTFFMFSFTTSSEYIGVQIKQWDAYCGINRWCFHEMCAAQTLPWTKITVSWDVCLINLSIPCTDSQPWT